jgi:hypothetical protein
MPKTFYTEIDIEDMVKRGTLSLEINDNVVLTDLAYEKANRLGVKLIPPMVWMSRLLLQAILPSAYTMRWWHAWGTRLTWLL